jgi:lysophospholipase L1-like esterase
VPTSGATSRSSVRLSGPPRRFVALGDSFSAGTEAGDTAPWPALVADTFREQRPELEFRNLAVEGCSSQDVVDNQLGEALSFKPDLVSVICGANDVLLTARPDEEAFRQALDSTLSALAGLSPEPLIVTATYPAVAPDALRERTAKRVTEGIEGFNRAIAELSATHGTLCLNLAAHSEVDVGANFDQDGFHPSARGHKLAAEAFVHAVRETIDEEAA